MARTVDIPDVPKEKRRNPQSLRKIIAHLIFRLFNGEKERTINELSTHRQRSGARKPGSVIKRGVLYGILSDKSDIKYRHLEAFAYKAGVPTYVLLLFSRAYSDQQDINNFSKAYSDHQDATKRLELNLNKDVDIDLRNSFNDNSDIQELRKAADEARLNKEKMILFSKMIPSLVESHSNNIEDIDEWIETFKGSYHELT
ncbi:hypothetical protein [Donghicola eburneus]|uniref:hypothetical protein n=1 Tax=Donghicola eburneus TaxID=393278 RepID=UPI0008E88A14|nr:hypothetical protein [Donghicola eburneus]SFQ77713.1 hypothetical protein SAMN05421764_1208 [Donghicola eburneus]